MAEKNSAQTNRQTNRHYENNGHLAVNQLYLCLGSSAFRQCLSSDMLRNNFLSPADMSSSILKVWQQNPRLKAFRNKLSRQALSPIDNCSAKEGRAQVITDNTMAVNIICKASRDNP